MTDKLAATLAERGARYGKFADHAVIVQGIKEVMWTTPGWGRLAADQAQALEVVADKIARILNGDPNYVDNWHNIAGYARLVEDRLVEQDTESPREVPTKPPYDSSWIEWTGGKCPVLFGTAVDIKLRNGDIMCGHFACNARWHWASGDHPNATRDIVAYRIAKVD